MCEGFWGCLAAGLSSEIFRNVFFLVGVGVAVASVLSARATAKKKQSADLLASIRNDKELIDGLRKLAELHNRADSNIRQYAQDANSATPEAVSIRYVLNHWEYVAVGVQGGIYDEDMLRKASHNTVVSLYNHARPFIECLRECKQRPSLYQEMQEMAERWDRKGQPKAKKKKPLAVG
ncbi:DUF4760 domain-containing protein [Pseudomonas aeruginosa]